MAVCNEKVSPFLPTAIGAKPLVRLCLAHEWIPMTPTRAARQVQMYHVKLDRLGAVVLSRSQAVSSALPGVESAAQLSKR